MDHLRHLQEGLSKVLDIFIKGKLRPKKQYSPQVKLKQLQWEKIPENMVESTLWVNMNEEKWESHIDFTKVESMFSAKSSGAIASTNNSND